MQITSSPVGGSVHVLSDAIHAQTEQAHPETTVNPQSSSTTANPLVSLTATNGLHPAAVDTMKASVDANAQRAGKPNPGKMNFEHYFDKASVGGLHPVAGDQATSTAKEGGLAGFLHSLANSILNKEALERLAKAVEGLGDDEGEEDEGD